MLHKPSRHVKGVGSPMNSVVNQGGHKPGKHGKPGKLREFKKLSKSQGNLNFYRKNWKTQGKCKIFGIIVDETVFHRIQNYSGKHLKMTWKSQGKLREFSYSKMWPPCKPSAYMYMQRNMVDSFCLNRRKKMKNFKKSTFQFIHFHLIHVPDQKNPCQNINILHEDFIKMGLILFDMAFS